MFFKWMIFSFFEWIYEYSSRLKGDLTIFLTELNGELLKTMHREFKTGMERNRIIQDIVLTG